MQLSKRQVFKIHSYTNANQMGTLQQLLSTIESRQKELENMKALNEESRRATATVESGAKSVLEDTKKELEKV
jgi:cell division protein FtsB